MKFIFTTVAIFCSLCAFSQEDFVIRINDTSINVALDRSYNINVKGSNLNFTVSSKDTLNFDGETYNFLYPKAFRVSSNKLEGDVNQIAIMTAEGSGFLIQEFETLNPSSLNEMMLQEITKESLSYGFTESRTNYQVKLKSGQEVKITKAILRYKDEVNNYEIASFGKKDAGLIIITMRMDDNDQTDGKKLIDLMWKSLRVQ